MPAAMTPDRWRCRPMLQMMRKINPPMPTARRRHRCPRGHGTNPAIRTLRGWTLRERRRARRGAMTRSGHGAAINAPVSARFTTSETLLSLPRRFLLNWSAKQPVRHGATVRDEVLFRNRRELRESIILKNLVTPYLASLQRFDFSLVSAMFALKAGSGPAMWGGGSGACEGPRWQSQQ